MYKIIGADRKEYGPVSSDQINAWIQEGRANGRTLAQEERQAEWKPLFEFPEFGAVLGATDHPATAPPGIPQPAVLADVLLSRPADLDIGRCLGRAWRLVLKHPGPLLGSSALLALIQTGLGFVPFAGPMAGFVLSGVLYGGFFMVVLNRARGNPAGVGELFAGFGPDFVQLMLAGIVSQVLVAFGLMCCALPGIYLAVAWQFSFLLVLDKRLGFWAAMELSRKVVTRYWFQVLGLLVAGYLPVILFAGYSAARMYEVVRPMIQRGGGFDFNQLPRLVKVSSSFSLGQAILLVFVLPFACSALIYAYEDVFDTRPAPAA